MGQLPAIGGSQLIRQGSCFVSRGLASSSHTANCASTSSSSKGRKAFQLKQFRVYDDLAVHKVGTDSVLLGAWVNRTIPTENAKNILDVGTGCGLLALMMAQNFYKNATVDAVEIDEGSYTVAMENVRNSGWADSIRLHNMPFQQYVKQCGARYDIIITNPPYYIASKSFKSPISSRASARQDLLLPFADLAQGASKLLAAAGKLCIILPAPEAEEFQAVAETHGLGLLQRLRLRTTLRNSTDKRFLMQYALTSTPQTVVDDDVMYVHGSSGQYSQEYRDLTKDYYIIF